MDTKKLQSFAPSARVQLIQSVKNRIQAVLAEDSIERRETPYLVFDLEKALPSRTGPEYEQFAERIAYTWFNRFCAFRFFDVNGATDLKGVVTPVAGHIQPQILEDARSADNLAHVIPSIGENLAAYIQSLLNRFAPGENTQEKAYKSLLLCACDHLHKKLPWLFEKMESYSSLLLPDSLLAEGSLLQQLRASLTDEDCTTVETLGWLYQYYNSELKEQVDQDKKKGKKVTAETLPAATQLFTPEWIVRYLVDNSLGRLWLLNHPDSRLKRSLEYYIEPADQLNDFCTVSSPEELTFADPCAGSGHMCVYAFDLLMKIYEESGYTAQEAVRLILRSNIRALEIDPRAAQITRLSLTLKACQYDRRFLRRPIEPRVSVIVPAPARLREYQKTFPLAPNVCALLEQMRDAAVLGSLVRPCLTAAEIDEALEELLNSPAVGNLLYSDVHMQIIDCLTAARALTEQSAVVVTNPPYQGSSSLCAVCVDFLKKNYADSKSDLFAAFIERCLELTERGGLCGMVTMQSWMFLSSFEKLRQKLLKEHTLVSMAHIGARGFDAIGGEVVSTAAFVIERGHEPNYHGSYKRLVDGASEQAKQELFFRSGTYSAAAEDFAAIPGSPVAYWVSDKARKIFADEKPLGSCADAVDGLGTRDDKRFLKLWYEVPLDHIGFGMKNREEAQNGGLRWFPCNKGGESRKWWGNQEYVVNWQNDGEEIRNFRNDKGKLRSRPQNMDYYFRESVSWSDISSSVDSFRFFPQGFINNEVGQAAYGGTIAWKKSLLSYVNLKFVSAMTRILNPTIHFHIGYFNKLPYARKHWNDETVSIAERCIELARADWDDHETSWDFARHPLVIPYVRSTPLTSCPSLEESWHALRSLWANRTARMKSFEERNNALFIKEYDLADEMTPDVPLEQITLFGNPAYRYSGAKTSENIPVKNDDQKRLISMLPDDADAGLELRLCTDTLKELVSYAIGCAFGRYSLSKDGLILANQGSTLEDFKKKVPDAAFMPVARNAISMTGVPGLEEDAVALVKRLFKAAFGEENCQENLCWLDAMLVKSGGLAGYLNKQFYKDHVQRYKKRPIYWLFTSPQGSFKALIYLHRYSKNTVSEVLDLLRAHMRAIQEQIEASEKIWDSLRASEQREIERLKAKVLPELRAYEIELFKRASDPLELDLDDGVRVNYPKLYPLVEAIKGLDAQE